jgi:hypothetical protein
LRPKDERIEGAPAAREPHPLSDLRAYLEQRARQNPATAALVCFGIGFVLGWKLKPW